MDSLRRKAQSAYALHYIEKRGGEKSKSERHRKEVEEMSEKIKRDLVVVLRSLFKKIVTYFFRTVYPVGSSFFYILYFLHLFCIISIIFLPCFSLSFKFFLFLFKLVCGNAPLKSTPQTAKYRTEKSMRYFAVFGVGFHLANEAFKFKNIKVLYVKIANHNDTALFFWFFCSTNGFKRSTNSFGIAAAIAISIGNSGNTCTSRDITRGK